MVCDIDITTAGKSSVTDCSGGIALRVPEDTVMRLSRVSIVFDAAGASVDVDLSDTPLPNPVSTTCNYDVRLTERLREDQVEKYRYPVDQRCGGGMSLSLTQATIEAARVGRVDIDGKDMTVTLGTKELLVETDEGPALWQYAVVAVAGLILLAALAAFQRKRLRRLGWRGRIGFAALVLVLAAVIAYALTPVLF